jgi:hypothetical protein
MDIRLTTALISAGVALFIAVLNHFIITPIKEKRANKRSKLKNFYAPLYSLVSSRLNLVKPQIVMKQQYMLGSKSESKYFNKEYMEMFFLERSGYASDELIKTWIELTSSLVPDPNKTKRFINQLVKEYNQLKKELGMEYNKKGLQTGIPEVLKDVKMED